MSNQADIKVMDILLWSENSRLPDLLSGKSQDEIRQALLKDEKRFGVLSLANEIIKDQDLIPTERIILLEEEGKYISYEGNRRVLAYQCIINPELAAEHKKDFEKIVSKSELNKDFKVECVVASDLVEANRYIERKHLKGNNEKPWGQLERDNHSARVKRFGGNADKERIKRANIAKLLNSVDLPDSLKKQVLGPGYITNFYRMVDSTPGYQHFGIKVKDDGEVEISDPKGVNNKLKVFVWDLLTKKQPLDGQSWSRAYNKTGQIKEYFESSTIGDLSEIDKKIEASKVTDIFGNEEIKVTEKGTTIFSSSKPKEYQTLIKPTKKLLNLKPDSLKIAEVYNELKLIAVKECPHAVSVVVRVLIEITVRRFLDLNGEKFTDDGFLIISKQKPKRELKEKLNFIATNYATGQVKKSIQALNENLLTQSLNQVVHNCGYFATEKQIRDFWKNLEGVFEYMVGAIIEKENGTSKNP